MTRQAAAAGSHPTTTTSPGHRRPLHRAAAPTDGGAHRPCCRRRLKLFSWLLCVTCACVSRENNQTKGGQELPAFVNQSSLFPTHARKNIQLSVATLATATLDCSSACFAARRASAWFRVDMGLSQGGPRSSRARSCYQQATPRHANSTCSRSRS